MMTYDLDVDIHCI